MMSNSRIYYLTPSDKKKWSNQFDEETKNNSKRKKND